MSISSESPVSDVKENAPRPMSERIAALIGRIRVLEEELEVELAERRAELQFSIHERTIKFEKEMLRRHRELKSRLSHYVLSARPAMVLTAPVIYSVLIPLVLLDLFASIYQAVCFPVYRIAKVKRGDYLVFDRSQLAYLNAIEKVNCAYCSYANGLIAYVREIAARTEQYWCPIKHARRISAAHRHYSRFLDYGDAKAYRAELDELRQQLAPETDRR